MRTADSSSPSARSPRVMPPDPKTARSLQVTVRLHADQPPSQGTSFVCRALDNGNKMSPQEKWILLKRADGHECRSPGVGWSHVRDFLRVVFLSVAKTRHDTIARRGSSPGGTTSAGNQEEYWVYEYPWTDKDAAPTLTGDLEAGAKQLGQIDIPQWTPAHCYLGRVEDLCPQASVVETEKLSSGGQRKRVVCGCPKIAGRHARIAAGNDNSSNLMERAVAGGKVGVAGGKNVETTAGVGTIDRARSKKIGGSSRRVEQQSSDSELGRSRPSSWKKPFSKKIPKFFSSPRGKSPPCRKEKSRSEKSPGARAKAGGAGRGTKKSVEQSEEESSDAGLPALSAQKPELVARSVRRPSSRNAGSKSPGARAKAAGRVQRQSEEESSDGAGVRRPSSRNAGSKSPGVRAKAAGRSEEESSDGAGVRRRPSSRNNAARKKLARPIERGRELVPSSKEDLGTPKAR